MSGIGSADEPPASQPTETFSCRCHAVCGAAAPITGRRRDLGKGRCAEEEATQQQHANNNQPICANMYESGLLDFVLPLNFPFRLEKIFYSTESDSVASFCINSSFKLDCPHQDHVQESVGYVQSRR